MPLIRNALANSRYSVDVYRPTLAQQSVAGYTASQWIATQSATPYLTGVAVLVGIDPTVEITMVLGNEEGLKLRMQWLTDDIQEQDVVLVHGPASAPYTGKYFEVHRVTQMTTIQPSDEYQQTAWLYSLKAGYPTG